MGACASSAAAADEPRTERQTRERRKQASGDASGGGGEMKQIVVGEKQTKEVRTNARHIDALMLFASSRADRFGTLRRPTSAVLAQGNRCGE